MNKDYLEKATELAERVYSTVMSPEILSDGTVNFLARNPELEGCKAQGTSPMDAMNNLRDARIDYIYFLLEDGLDVPMPKSQSFQAHAPRLHIHIQDSIGNLTILETKSKLDSQDNSIETWSSSEVIEFA